MNILNGRFAGVRRRLAAAKTTLALAAQFGPDELERRLQLVQDFSANGDGRGGMAPPQLTLGIELLAEPDGQGGKLYGLVRPSQASGRQGPSQATQVFHNPTRDYGLLVLGSATERAKTLNASLMLRSVPASAEGLVETIGRLTHQVPPVARGVFKQSFLTPLRNLVLPPDRDDPFVRRELVLWVPAALAFREWFGQLTALLDKEPLSPGEVAALIAATLAGRPAPDAFAGPLEELLWRAAPRDPQPLDGVFFADGERFAFYYMEPRFRAEALEALLKLDLDYLLTLEMVHGQAKGQLLARGRDNIPGSPGLRAAHFKKRLEPCCSVVKVLTSPDDMVTAHWAFQPGSPQSMDFGTFPIPDPRAFVLALTGTISTPRDDGNVFVGIEPLGARYLLPLGHPKKGGILHFVVFGEGGVGKTTLINLVSAQIAATMQVVFGFNETADEALPALSYLWSPHDRDVRLVADYTDGERMREGIHHLCIPSRGSNKAAREWAVNFHAERGVSLRNTFDEKVVPAVRAWVENLRIPEDFPISVRPLEGCNPALFAAAAALAWSGRTPWEEDLFLGLQSRIVAHLTTSGQDLRCVLRLDDVGKMPTPLDDPNDVPSRCTLAVQKVIFDVTSAAHKSGVHLILGCHTPEELDLFLPGTIGRFHQAVVVGRQEVSGVKKRTYTLYDPRRLDEPKATLIGDLNDYPALLNLLTRE